MPKVKICVDSTCDLSPELVKKYDIEIVPIHVILGDKSYRDGVDITPEEIFKWSDENKTTPKTAALTIPQATELFERHISNGYEVVYISISSEMSSSYGLAKMVAETVGGKVAVVDSKNLSTGVGLIVLKAAELAQEGHDCYEIKEILETQYVPRVRTSFVIDTVTYLYRGGRCSAVAAFSATALNIKPTIVVENGKMRPDVKFQGKIDRVLLKYAQKMKDNLLKADKQRVFVTHTPCKPEVVQEIIDFLKDLNYFDEILETTAGGAVSCHCVPGTLGILYIEGQ